MKLELKRELATYFKDIREGNVRGISWGYDKLDKTTGRMEPGQITTIAAYSGVGKSYFAGNVIDNILHNDPSKKINVYSSEMDTIDYVKRHIYMRAGVWSMSHKNYPQQHSAKVESAAAQFMSEQDLSPNLDIIAPIFDWLKIKEHLYQTKPDVFFIDFIQQIYTGSAKRISDAMPLIAMDLLETVKDLKTNAVILSQVTNYSTAESRVDTMRTAMDHGKELYRLSHRSFTLQRKKVEGELSRTMDLYIDKSREGQTGLIPFDILEGYRLREQH